MPLVLVHLMMVWGAAVRAGIAAAGFNDGLLDSKERQDRWGRHPQTFGSANPYADMTMYIPSRKPGSFARMT